nr:HNH endonuclease [Rhodococcus sp. MEB041]
MKYSEARLRDAVARSVSVAGVLRHLGITPAGGSHAHISRRIRRLGIDTAHFTGQAHRRGQSAANRHSAADILVIRPRGAARAKPHHLRRALRESGVPESCAGCGLGGTWNGAPLRLHVDHIDGNNLDCRLVNLRFLCPNCHSQTSTWASRTPVYGDDFSTVARTEVV